MPRKQDLQKLIALYAKRLNLLKEQQAAAGMDAAPGVVLEIEALEGELEKLRAELSELEAIEQAAPKTPPPLARPQPSLRPPSTPPPGPPPVGARPAPPTAPPGRRNTLLWVAIGAALLLLPILSGLAVYFLVANQEPNATVVPTQTTAVAETTPQSEQTPTATATFPPNAPPSPDPTNTEPATGAVALESDIEPSATMTPTVTPSATPTTPPPTATATRPSPTATSTPTRPPTSTLAPTATPTATPRPVPRGPTLVPLSEVAETVDRFGAREVTDVDINLKNPREVYVLVKGDGLYKSSNGGNGPWAKMKVDASGVTAFVIDPTDPARFYGPTWVGVLYSTDGGNSWDVSTAGLSGVNASVDTLAVDPVNPNLIYAGIGNTLVVSPDRGKTWSSAEYGKGEWRGGRLTRIVIDPFDHNTLYIGGRFGAIYRSDDSGRTFRTLTFLQGSLGEGTFGLAAHPTQPDVYFAGVYSADAAIIKTENGADFQKVGPGLIDGAAYSAITFAPSNPDIIYAGTGYEADRWAKGIFKSVDGGQNWTEISNGLSIVGATGEQPYVKAIAVHPTNPNLVFAASGGGLYKSVDGGGRWQLQ